MRIKYQKRPTKETYKRNQQIDLQKKELQNRPGKETCKHQWDHPKKTYMKDVCSSVLTHLRITQCWDATHMSKETYKRDIQKKPTWKTYIAACWYDSAYLNAEMQHTCQKRDTKEPLKRHLQKRPTKESWKHQWEHQKRPTKKTDISACWYVSAYLGAEMRITCQKRPTKETYKRDL